MIEEITASLYCIQNQLINREEIIDDTGKKWTKSWNNILEYDIRGRGDGIKCSRESASLYLYFSQSVLK